MNRRLTLRRLSLAGFSLVVTIAMLPLRAQPADDARAAIELLLKQQETAWNQGDGAGFAASFTSDADFVNIRGDVFHGQQMIAARHAFILATPFKGSHDTITVRQFTEIAPGVALVETEHTVTGYRALPPGIAPTAPGVLKTRMKYIAVKQDGQWKFIAAQNTAVAPAPPTPPQ